MGLLERMRRWNINLGDGLESYAAIKCGIAIGHSNVHALMPEGIKSVGDQTFHNMLALMCRRYSNGPHHEYSARIARIGQPREKDVD